MKILLSASDISKEFLIGCKENANLTEFLIYHISGRSKQKKIMALKNITFELEEGKSIGLIGRNGAGKSTLLKILAGIYMPTKGKVTVSDKIFYMSGYSLGLNSKLTARENIYFMGTLYGLTKTEIDSLFEKIIDFSKLNDFIDTKIYQFSSGMKTRLSFSASIHFIIFNKPKVILMDEVFSAAADAEFDTGSSKKTEELLQNGTTIILATHNMNMVKKYCKEIILLEKGEIISKGDPEKVTQDYTKLIKERNEVKKQ